MLVWKLFEIKNKNLIWASIFFLKKNVTNFSLPNVDVCLCSSRIINNRLLNDGGIKAMPCDAYFWSKNGSTV